MLDAECEPAVRLQAETLTMAPTNPFRVFYCWQSDTKAAANRTLIGDALERAIVGLARDAGIEVEPVDRDTQGVPGSPEIAATIFEKLRTADAIVADLTLVNAGSDGRRTPNPNVLVEVGFVLGASSSNKLICVVNTAMGAPEDLPFDLRHRRVAKYASPEDADSRTEGRRQLEGQLRDALKLIIDDGRAERERLGHPVTLSVSHRRIALAHGVPPGERHDYELVIRLLNGGTKVFNTWSVDVDLPTPLRVPNEGHLAIVGPRSNEHATRFRFDHRDREALHPGDPIELTVPYTVTRDTFYQHKAVFADGVVRVRLTIDDEVLVDEQHAVATLQNF